MRLRSTLMAILASALVSALVAVAVVNITDDNGSSPTSRLHRHDHLAYRPRASSNDSNDSQTSLTTACLAPSDIYERLRPSVVVDHVHRQRAIRPVGRAREAASSSTNRDSS